MKKSINLLRAGFVDLRDLQKLLHGSVFDLGKRVKMTHEHFSTGRTDTLDLIQNGSDICLAAQ